MDKPSRSTAAWTAASLSLLFVIVYKSTNWLASQHSDLSAWYYEWESYIPFVPWTVIPYMSIDLLFIAAPFFCRTRNELRTLSRQIVFATLTAGAFFLLLPLEMAGPRPLPHDWTRPIFQFLHGFDQPHNLFPSLHITFRTILAVHYARHTTGLWRWASHLWFSLIGFSTLLTYQHHFVDVAGGFVLALLALHLFREQKITTAGVLNLHVGTRYAIGSALLLSPLPLGWDWAWPFLWPSCAIAIVAGGYFGLGSVIFRKQNGRIPWSTKVFLSPILFGHYLSWIFYRRKAAPWNQVTPQLWIGLWPRPSEARLLRTQGVTAVLDLTAEFSAPQAFRTLPYLNLPILDLTAPTQLQLAEAVAFIEHHARAGRVYLHCKIGFSRSAAVAGAWLLHSGRARNVSDAISILRQARPQIVIRPEVLRALSQYAEALPNRHITPGTHTAPCTSPPPPLPSTAAAWA